MRRRTLWGLAIGIFTSINIHAQYSDCPGAGICHNQSGTLTAGIVNELDSANSGCLPDFEADFSYWFNICATTSGTICFTINPAGANNDYDFAVWGPNVFCVPAIPPIRCSYAVTPPGNGSNGDVTGLSNGSADSAQGPTGNSWLAPIDALAGECYLVYIGDYHSSVTHFNLVFTGTANYDCAILPVELTSFTATETMNGISVAWNCLSETNNSHFIVERTTDRTKYETIARIDGAGTTTQAMHYAITDPKPATGTNYYRIKQVDFNGQENFYGPVACEYNSSSPGTVEILTMSGQIIFSGESNNPQQTVNEQNLATGVYVITVTRGVARETFKHIVTNNRATD